MKCTQCGKKIDKTNTHSLMINGERYILCGKHYSQYIKHGHFLDNSQKSCFDMNEFTVDGDIAYIYTTNRNHQISGKFVIDAEDLDRVITHKWRYWRKRFYTGNFKPVSIHRFIMNVSDECVIDHIDGDISNNKKSNLRITTQNKNTINR